jgi:hypothetical protein
VKRVYTLLIVSGEQWCNVNCIYTESDIAPNIMELKAGILLEIVISTGRHNNSK